MLDLLRHERRKDVIMMESALATGTQGLVDAYAALRPWNFSRDFLTRIPEHLVAVRAAQLDWSDWGTPAAIERTLKTLGRRVPWQDAPAVAAWAAAS